MFITIFLVFFGFLVPPLVLGDCLMGGSCPTIHGRNWRNAPCVAARPASAAMDANFQDFLLNNCPNLFDADENLLGPVCCQKSQERAMAALVAQADLLGQSCPSCARNARTYFCNLFCHPNQDQIVKIEETIPTAKG